MLFLPSCRRAVSLLPGHISRHGHRHRLAGMSTTASAAVPSSNGPSSAPPLVMQLIVSKDLIKDSSTWTMGPMMAQAAHAATAVITQTYDQPATQSYLNPSNLKSMHKIVLQTSEPLTELSARLREAVSAAASSAADFPAHYLWIEEPESIATVLAIAPNTKPAALKKILSKCSLLRS